MDEKREDKSSEAFECDKLIIGYLIERQNQLDSYYDAQNTKVSQILVINGVLFGIFLILILDRIGRGSSWVFLISLIGILLLFLSTVIGILAYRSFTYYSGFPNNKLELENFIFNVDNVSSNERLKTLKNMIITSLDRNLKSLNNKVSLFNDALILQYLSIASLFIGYFLIIFYTT
jgi:hypothetical protein